MSGPQLDTTVARRCVNIIRRARKAGVCVPPSLFLDLCADNLPKTPLAQIRAALQILDQGKLNRPL